MAQIILIREALAGGTALLILGALAIGVLVIALKS